MAFLLGEDHDLLRKTVREFAEKEIAPRAKEVDETHEFPWDNVKRCAEMNLMGITTEEEYGGAGSDMLSRAIALEEISRASATVGIIVGASGLVCDCVGYAGTDEQKKKYLAPMAKGEKLGAFGLTEPNAGSDAGGLQSTAVRDGDSWVINGSKCFITNCGPAEYYIIVAKTPEEPDVKGPSAFIVEKGTPGFTIGRLEDKMGLNGSATGDLIFTDCRIPAANLLGKLGRGLALALQALDRGRICVASMANGNSQAALDAAVAFAKQRKTFGKPIAAHQAISFYLAEMATKLEAARCLTYRAASLNDAGLPFGKEAAMAKYYCAEVSVWCADKCIQIHGGYGYTKNFPAERYLREAKLWEIGEGTSEIQKMVIGRYVVG